MTKLRKKVTRPQWSFQLNQIFLCTSFETLLIVALTDATAAVLLHKAWACVPDCTSPKKQDTNEWIIFVAVTIFRVVLLTTCTTAHSYCPDKKNEYHLRHPDVTESMSRSGCSHGWLLSFGRSLWAECTIDINLHNAKHCINYTLCELTRTAIIRAIFDFTAPNDPFHETFESRR